MEKILFSAAAIAAGALINKLYKDNKELKRQLLYKGIDCHALEKMYDNLIRENMSLRHSCSL